MPIYFFKCSECDNEKELLIKYGINETACKECGAELGMKKQDSFYSVSHGLPNGHIGLRKGFVSTRKKLDLE